jgi:hypothetical protein
MASATGDSIEEVLQALAGYTLGGNGSGSGSPAPSGGDSAASTTAPMIPAEVRPGVVKGSQGARWVWMESRHQKVVMTWHPSAEPGKVIFWRFNGYYVLASRVEWVVVQISGPSAPTENGGQILETIGKAWTDLVTQGPTLFGPRTHFDPQTIKDVENSLRTMSGWGDRVNTDLTKQIAGINDDDSSFRGSALEAFEHRVHGLQSQVRDISSQLKPAQDALSAAHVEATKFISTFRTELEALRALDGGMWADPRQALIRILNSATLVDSQHNTDLVKSSLGPRTLVDPDGASIRNTNGGPAEVNESPLLISFPTLPAMFADAGIDASFFTEQQDAFAHETWAHVDHILRRAWATKVERAFTGTIAAARTLDRALEEAWKAMHMAPAAPLPPGANPSTSSKNPPQSDFPPIDFPPIDFPPFKFPPFKFPPPEFGQTPPPDGNGPDITGKTPPGLDGTAFQGPGENGAGVGGAGVGGSGGGGSGLGGTDPTTGLPMGRTLGGITSPGAKNRLTAGTGAGSGRAGLLPTTLDGVDVTSAGRRAQGFQVPDLSGPVSATLPSGGAGVATGGLNREFATAAGGLGGPDGAGLAGGTGLPGAAGGAGNGMPYLPPMGGAGGGRERDRDRERATLVTEDEDTWGTSPHCGPAVIGRGELPEEFEPEIHTDLPVPTTGAGGTTADTRARQRGRA